MSDADHVASFLALAQEDLEAARLLKAGAPRQAAFFLQQAADPARIHAIGKLAAELSDIHPLKAELMALDRLSVNATATRYPSPTGKLPRIPNPVVIETDMRAVADLLDHARSFLGRLGGSAQRS